MIVRQTQNFINNRCIDCLKFCLKFFKLRSEMKQKNSYIYNVDDIGEKTDIHHQSIALYFFIAKFLKSHILFTQREKIEYRTKIYMRLLFFLF